jgi:hypothetical protein
MPEPCTIQYVITLPASKIIKAFVFKSKFHLALCYISITNLALCGFVTPYVLEAPGVIFVKEPG